MLRFSRYLFSILVFSGLAAVGLAQTVPQMVVKPIEAVPVGAPIDVEVGLFGNNDRPLANNVIEIYLDGEYLRRSRTDENGLATIRVSRDLSLGNYEITVRFVGTRDYLESEVKLPITVRPIYLTIQTVPPLEGIEFQLAEAQLESNSEGLVRFEITTPGTYNLAALLEPHTQISPDTRVTFARWVDEIFTPQRTIEITRSDMHIQIGFFLSHAIQTHFIDLAGEPIDWSRVSSITLKSSSAAHRTIEKNEPYWLQSNRILRQRTGIFPTEVLWSVESVMLDGSNVVNRYQQRFLVKPNDDWEIQLLVYQARITSKDTLFGRSIGTGVSLTLPDGSVEQYPFDDQGELYVYDMARGQYKMQVDGASGVAPLTPVALTKDQDVELKVLSGLDIATLMTLGVVLALGLLFYGRPHLIRLKPRPARTDPKVLAWLSEPFSALPPPIDDELPDYVLPFLPHTTEGEVLFGVQLLEPVLYSHLKIIALPIAKRLRISPERVISQLSVQPSLITKPIPLHKAIHLSKILGGYGVKNQVVMLTQFPDTATSTVPPVYTDNPSLPLNPGPSSGPADKN
jgi:hypothetical protein